VIVVTSCPCGVRPGAADCVITRAEVRHRADVYPLKLGEVAQPEVDEPGAGPRWPGETSRNGGSR
jgi:hypothetical protein